MIKSFEYYEITLLQVCVYEFRATHLAKSCYFTPLVGL